MDKNNESKNNPLGLSKRDLETLFEKSFESTSKNNPKEDPKEGVFKAQIEQEFIEEKSQHEALEPTTSKPLPEDSKVKTPLRIKYEAEVDVIKKEVGDLEEIRRILGLSKRKTAQLLLVDPSAWTRWTSPGSDAPPHIYRALHWLLLLQEKHPEYKSSLWLNAVATPSLSQHEIENIKKEVVEKAYQEVSQKQKTSYSAKQPPSSNMKNWLSPRFLIPLLTVQTGIILLLLFLR